MGRWNTRRTWVPQRRHQKEEERRPSPPPYKRVDSEAILQNSALPWEQKFCHLAGIPFYKVNAAKKYIYCHENVLNWNDSACKDALNDAKERFYAMINGLPCEVPLPDQDMYIDVVDWNTENDHELMSELEKDYFNPDEAKNSSSNKRPGSDEKNRSTDDNPWESHRVNDTIDIKDVAQSWNNQVESKNVVNPWEKHSLDGDKDLKDKWGSCANKPFGWNKGPSAVVEPSNSEFDRVNSWNQGSLGSNFVNQKGGEDAWKVSNQKSNDCTWKVSRGEDAWKVSNQRSRGNAWKASSGEDAWKASSREDAWKASSREDAWKASSREDAWKASSGEDAWKVSGWDNAWKASGGWNSRSNESGNARNVNSWKPHPSETSDGRQLTDHGDNSRRYNSSGRVQSGGGRKREGYQEHTWRQKSWKHEGADSEARQFWGRGRP